MRVADKITDHRVPPGRLAIWWLGQNSFVLKDSSALIMVDPFFSRPGPAERYIHDEAPLRGDELSPDAVFCTHSHWDHTDPPFLSELAQQSPATRFFGPPESGEEMVKAGISADRVTTLQAGQAVQLGAASVEVVFSKTREVSDVTHYGYVFTVGDGVRVYNTGDIMRGATKEAVLMESLRQAAPQVALITMSPTEEEFPDFEEASLLAQEIGAGVAVPSHYDCFADRTFDPQGFAAVLRAGAAVEPAIIEYCGVYLPPPAPANR
jgi:L-ascorbate 6-phosphate lactonase